MDKEVDDDDRGIDDGVPVVGVPRTFSPPLHPSRGADDATMSTSRIAYPLTQDQIRTFVNEGVLVVPDVLTPSQLSDARSGLNSTLLHHGVDPSDLLNTGHNLRALSSTDGSGGVLDVFYPRWKMELSTNETLFRITTQLWEAGYCRNGETEEDMLAVDGEGGEEDGDEYFKYHPHGPFDCSRGYAYLDRIGYRLPTRLSEELGRRQQLLLLREKKEEELKRQRTKDPEEDDNDDQSGGNSGKNDSSEGKKHSSDRKAERAKRWNNNTKKKTSRSNKPRPLQRSLTPHLDVCPPTLHDLSEKQKWRPIQCLISLTDTPHPNMGGFEAAINPGGFHRSFRRWTRTRAPSISRGGGGVEEEPPCVGEYTPLRPREDADVMARIGHVPVMAGGAIFWDNRVPHGNAYRHDGDGGDEGDGEVDGRGYGAPRAVAYCSFLPDVEINRRYVRRQLEDWRVRRRPRDRWIEIEDDDGRGSGGGGGGGGGLGGSARARDVEEDQAGEDGEGGYEFSELGRKLMGIDEW